MTLANDISAENKKYVLFPWSKQAGLSPAAVTRAEGSFFWDADGRRFIDMYSQLSCVNAGHNHPKVVAAIQEQAERMCYIAPAFATDVKGRLARMVAEVSPGTLNKSYFTSGGAEANEYAVKIAKMVTGRPKIITRYRSYHGATTGAISLTGDFRRAYNEPAMPGVVHSFQPYCYHCTFGQEPNSCHRECLSSLAEQIEFENPDFIAAVFIEGITGPGAGLYIPPDDYMVKLRALCDKYGILLVADEVMSGWGRTGKWFGIEHFGIQPDIMTVAKGLTNSAVPMGAVVVSDKIADHLETHTLWSGSTYSGHPLACAAGIASLQVYREEGLVERSARLGAVLMSELERMKARHPSVGDVRGKGLWTVIELVKDRVTHESLMPSKEEPYAVAGGMSAIKKILNQGGVYLFTRPNFIAIAPALNIPEDLMMEGLSVVDKALYAADEMLASTKQLAMV